MSRPIPRTQPEFQTQSPEMGKITSLSFTEPSHDDERYTNIYIFYKNDWNIIKARMAHIGLKSSPIEDGSIIEATGFKTIPTIMDHKIVTMRYKQKNLTVPSKNIEDQINQDTGIARNDYLKFSKISDNLYKNKNNTIPLNPRIGALVFGIKHGRGKTKKIRKHKGIIQTGGNAGKLKKGYKYSGKTLKSGKPQIIKISK